MVSALHTRLIFWLGPASIIILLVLNLRDGRSPYATRLTPDIFHDCIDQIEAVATYSPHTYMLEDVFNNVLSHPSCPKPAPTVLSKILFVIMCSRHHTVRLHILTETWLYWIHPHNVVLVSDQHIDGFNTTLLPLEVMPHTFNLALQGNVSDYHAANLRHLGAVKWLGSRSVTYLTHYDWVFMVDDDTFVNPPLLLKFLTGSPPGLPVLFSFLWDGIAPVDASFYRTGHRTAPHMLAWPCGGGGTLLSKLAFQRFSVALFNDNCSFDAMYYDAALGECSVVAKVLKVHSLKFKPEKETITYNPSYKPTFMHDPGMWITQHRGNMSEMHLYTCTVAQRFGWFHPKCETSTVCGPVCNGKFRGMKRQFEGQTGLFQVG